MRIEHDLLGEIEVPASALYGAQTRRAILNFPLAGEKIIGDYADMVDALMIIKLAAANTNLHNGHLDNERAEGVAGAARAILAGQYRDQFPVHYLHGGGGTSANMNANEVLANLAEESLGGRRGAYRLVHPNDHVNLHQSTNDVYPTACHIAVIRKWPALERALYHFSESLLRQAREWSNVRRIARTCLQDAVDITFGDLFGGYAALVERSTARLRASVDRLHSVNLGGTIVGRTEDVPPPYLARIMEALNAAADDGRYRMAENLFHAAQSPEDLIAVSADLDLLARGLIKIAADFRLLSSGPEAGLEEIVLPAVQPGSSMMPGKINPVIPEFLVQLCFQTIGKHSACAMAMNHGELDLNVWESIVVFNILDAMSLLTNAVTVFTEKCVDGLKVNIETNQRNAGTIIPLLTRLAKQHGYSTISDLCKEASGDPERIRKVLAERRLS
jgi:aspartate ammonia-lyase